MRRQILSARINSGGVDMKNSEIAVAIGIGVIAGAAVSMAAMPKKNKLMVKANKAIKTADQVVSGISDALNGKN